MGLKCQLILAILALQLCGDLTMELFIDHFEANNFLRRSRRSNRNGRFFEEFYHGSQERECIEEDCNLEEAYETVDNLNKGRQFWAKYQRCRQVPTFKSAALEDFYPSREDEARVRVARQAWPQKTRSEAEKSQLRQCIRDTDQCTPYPCVRSNTEKCVDLVNNYECECKDGFTGRKCESPVNECLSNPCLNSARCEDEIGGFRCVCDDRHEGVRCQSEISDCRNVASKMCGLHGRCTAGKSGESYSCVCVKGFQGLRCDADVDECSESSPCDQICTNTEGSFTCSCNDGYILSVDTMATCRDIDECNEVSHGCQHSCVNSPGGYHCKCHRGYQLDKVFQRYCEDIDECATNNGNCPIIEGVCGAGGKPCKTCYNTEGEYTCHCPVGFTLYEPGKPCQDIDECESSYHGCEQSCENFQGWYQCRCNKGYQLSFNGKTCSDVNECLADHGCDYRCTNNIGSYECTCNRGYALAEDRRSCDDEDECTNSKSRCGQICNNVEGNYECDCRPGFRLLGKYRCTDINECLSAPCGNNGICENEENGFRCNCKDGFSGKQCEVDENPCATNPCQNQGSCVLEAAGFSCQCADGYTGETCQVVVRKCDGGYTLRDDQCVDRDECLVDGICDHTCVNTPGSFTCLCDDGYVIERNRCEDIDECASNLCQQKCLNSPGSYRCTCDDGFNLAEDGRKCEKIFVCLNSEPRMLQEEHLLFGTRKKDIISNQILSLEPTFSFALEFRTYDRDAIVVAITDRTSQRYIYVTLSEGQVKVIADIDGTKTETTERVKASPNQDGKWHKIVFRKRKNRLRVSNDGSKLRDMRFTTDDFKSVDILSYGGVSPEVVLTASVQELADVHFQGCLRNIVFSGMTIEQSSEMLTEHVGCFENIGPGMYFNGSGRISMSISPNNILRMRFNFKSRVSQGVLAAVESNNRTEFSLAIKRNQVIAKIDGELGQNYSVTYTAKNMDSLCNDVWHICDVTLYTNRIRLYVDGIEAQTEALVGMTGVNLGNAANLSLGSRSGSTSDIFAGSLRNFVLNNRPLDVNNPTEIDDVYPLTIPL